MRHFIDEPGDVLVCEANAFDHTWAKAAINLNNKRSQPRRARRSSTGSAKGDEIGVAHASVASYTKNLEGIAGALRSPRAGRRGDRQAQTQMTEIERLAAQSTVAGDEAHAARQTGDEHTAELRYADAFRLATKVAHLLTARGDHSAMSHYWQAAARYALEYGAVAEARLTIQEGAASATEASLEPWVQFRDTNAWPDAWLVAAIRRDPPDEKSLDVLAARYWKLLYGRCQLLTLNQDKASDLAQEAWRRVLRARHTLKPGGNFPAYLTTVATNIWRDSHRLAKRSGPMAEHRLHPLDAPLSSSGEEAVSLAELLPDLSALRTQEQTVLGLDIDQALAQLAPRLREVLVARYLEGESCAEIGRRYGRTEQTISSWVRQAIRAIKQHLEDCQPDLSKTVS
jgi:RNA polymerase sigma-70 factor (ECF subfamily)